MRCVIHGSAEALDGNHNRPSTSKEYLAKRCDGACGDLRVREFLKHNELELACDMLELYAENHVASEAFWIALRDAAAKMGSSDRARRYEEFASGR